MRKFLMPALVALLLVGCNNNSNEVVNPDTLFKEDIAKVLNIENTSNKVLMSNMSSDAIVDIVDTMMKNEHLTELYASYGVESQGIGTDSNGKKVFCYKLPVEFSLDGNETEIHEFVEELDSIPSKIAVSKFDITNNADEFHVDAVVNFLGDMESTSIASNSSINLKKNDVEVNEESNTILRDFDVNLTIRPSNSDSSAVTLGVKNSSNCLYSDDNSKHDVFVKFFSQNGKIYAEYDIDGYDSRTESFNTSGDIKFDVLSCKKILEDDYIDVDMTINNTLDKKVSVIIYDDDDGRVNIVSKSGKVEVLNK